MDIQKFSVDVKFVIIILLFFVKSLTAFCQDELFSGLYFSSQEVIQEKRTSLNLSPDGAYNFPDGFSMEMEANFRHGDGNYGYIFRIIGDDHTNIDLVSNLASTSSNFWLVVKDKVLFSYKWADIPDSGFDRWIKIKVSVDIADSKLAVSFNGNLQEIKLSAISGLRNFDIVFGACRNSYFYNTDISPMSLKDIRIFDSKNKLIRNWKLSKHSENKVYDEITFAEAQVENPIWNIDKHIKWSRLKDLKIDSLLGITKDEENGRVFFINKHAVYVLSTKTSVVDTIPFAGGLPYSFMGKQIIYNKFTNELWSYNFYKSQISKFSFITNTWSIKDTTTVAQDYWHHNKFISPVDSSLVTLFGYGFYTYKSLVRQYDKRKESWNQFDRINQIQPRYLSATGFLNNREMLVFGGYGSKTGRQELSPEFYYDLYSFSLNDLSFNKRWTLDSLTTSFVPCEELITDQKSGSFYTLVYNKSKFATALHLAKFRIDNNKYQLYTDSIPFSFLDIESWSTLFLDKKTTQLIAITNHNSDISLFTISYPPMMTADVYQDDQSKWQRYIGLTVFLLIVGLIIIFYILFRKLKGKNKQGESFQPYEYPNIVPVEPSERKMISSVLLMGGFQIYGSKGNSLTAAFSPTLKQLFLFIFLNTIRNRKGVSSSKLDEVFWYDKSGESARNNRNVNISKLRSILGEIGGLELINENLYWKIKIEDNIFCDYSEILGILRKAKTIKLTEAEIQQLVWLYSFGEFLPQIQTEWMDGFKSLFTNETIDGISSLLNYNDIRNNPRFRIQLAECILAYDPLNDEAFVIKCAALYRLGKKGIAKNLYNAYTREYKQVLGINYAFSFDEVIK